MHRPRRIGMIAALLAPVVLLAGVWLLVTGVLLKPGVPDADTPASQVFAFVVSDDGLVDLPKDRRDAVLKEQMRRLRRDDDFLRRFLYEWNTASPEDLKSFRNNFFRAYKPFFIDHARTYTQLTDEAARREFLDERIIEYYRLDAFRGKLTVGSQPLALPSQDELLNLFFSETSAGERSLLLSYANAWLARRDEILHNEALTAEYKARIASDE